MTPHNRNGLMVATLVVSALLSGQGFAEEQAPASAPAAAIAKKSTTPPRKPLDLRAPSITHLFSSEELNRILASTFVREDIEEVEVQGERDRQPTDTPRVWPGIAAPFWAVANPSQAWRIFAPLPPDQTNNLQYVRANATDTYVLEPAGVPSPHAR